MNLLSPVITPLRLHHPDGTTPVIVGEGAISSVLPELEDWLARRTAFLITTPRVQALHGDRLDVLRRAAARWVILEVEEGEGAKAIGSAERLWNEMLAAGGKRDSRVLAFGGGSVGDLAGFAAGCFLRGIEFVQIPTTLLAQVDAAIGGKTGVDLPGGKNTVGLFHHPWMVVGDTSVLSTLPREELRSGLVEVVKMAALLDPDLFGLRRGGAGPPARRRCRGARAGGGGGRRREDRRRGAGPDGAGGAPAAQLRPHARPRHRVGLRLRRPAPRRGGGVRHPLRPPPGPQAAGSSPRWPRASTA